MFLLIISLNTVEVSRAASDLHAYSVYSCARRKGYPRELPVDLLYHLLEGLTSYFLALICSIDYNSWVINSPQGRETGNYR